MNWTYVVRTKKNLKAKPIGNALFTHMVSSTWLYRWSLLRVQLHTLRPLRVQSTPHPPTHTRIHTQVSWVTCGKLLYLWSHPGHTHWLCLISGSRSWIIYNIQVKKKDSHEFGLTLKGIIRHLQYKAASHTHLYQEVIILITVFGVIDIRCRVCPPFWFHATSIQFPTEVNQWYYSTTVLYKNFLTD